MKNAHVSKTHRLAMTAMASLAVAIILAWAVAAQAQMAVHGTGTANTIPVWTSSSTQGNSVMKQSGGNINVTGGLTTTGPISAPSLSGNGSGVTNVNSAMLGGSLPSAFAQLAAPNLFTVDQTINANLGLTGSINNTLSLQGNLTDASQDVSANVIGGFGGNTALPGNSVASGVVGATIAGGGGSLPSFPIPNTVTDVWGTVGGGGGNTAGARFATVAGGFTNTAGNLFATVGGGRSNGAGEFGTVAGGDDNTASGLDSMVPGGFGNKAAGAGSFAAGFEAQANHDGSFVWRDDSLGAVVTDTAPNQFVARAAGGFTFYTAADLSTGAALAAGSGSWSMLSDRSTKANFSAIDGQSLLAKLATLPISTWNYKAQPDSVRHMGPTAQDFREAFGLGEDERHISTVDAQGVALAAIQALTQQVAELRARLAQLEQRQ